jgi:chitinase
MSKRDNPGLHFLDCPADVGVAPIHKQHTARIICVDGSEADCFGVANGGVEGTIVHLPIECGNGSYARALSLVPSQNQSIPVEIALQDPSSAV